MLLIKNVHVYGPEDLGIKDILIAGEKIELIQSNIEMDRKYVKMIDGTGKYVVPGFIDPHVHITGGGGEGGPHTKVPEIMLSTLLCAGITTVVGMLGTDGTTRTTGNLFSKAKSLKEEGLTVYALTGSYRYPTVTLTGDVQKDIVYIEECIGAKIAISDHRSSMVLDHELARLASDVRVAAMLSNKPGIVTVHIGDGAEGLNPINRVLKQTDIPITVFRPTHVNRKSELLIQSFDFAKAGGFIDVTCGISKEAPPSKVIAMAKEAGVPLDRITFSSDGGGSWSTYDEEGRLTEMGVSGVSTLFYEFRIMVKEFNYSISEALQFITSNTADSLGLRNKGFLKQGYDADMVILDKSFEIESVLMGGKLFVEAYKSVVKGTFE